MRVAVATLAPNVTLPIWARLFQRAILPTIDRCVFRAGSPLSEMRELARDVLGFAELDVRDGYQSHGVALTELYSQLPSGAQVLVLEDDCFVTCAPELINSIWERLPLVGGVMGSRMAKMATPEPHDGWWLDTYGDGLYPNMMFADVDVLRRHTDMDFTSRNRGDVGHMIGEQLHAAGVHTSMQAHLPQLRLSMYCGTRQVDPLTWDGPWLHVGEMSQPERFTMDGPRGGHFEAMATMCAALESGEVRPGPAAEKMLQHVHVTQMRWPEKKDYFDACTALMKRVFDTGKEKSHAVWREREGQGETQAAKTQEVNP